MKNILVVILFMLSSNLLAVNEVTYESYDIARYPVRAVHIGGTMYRLYYFKDGEWHEVEALQVRGSSEFWGARQFFDYLEQNRDNLSRWRTQN